MHLLNHCNNANGNVHVAVDLACAQAARGYDVSVASGGGHYTPLLAAHGVRHYLLPQTERNPLATARMVRDLVRIVRTTRADVLHAHMMTGAAIGFAAARVAGAKLVTHVHNSFDPHAILMGLGDRVIAVSTNVAEQMATRGVPRTRIRTVLNAPLHSPRRADPAPAPADLMRPSITTVCGLHGRKGVPDLLSAFAIVASQYAEAHLYIVGDGPCRAEYEQLALETGAGERIHFVGSARDPRAYLFATDIFVLASHFDPCPLVVPEAREAGCAIVATDVDGIPEALDGGDAGALVPARAPEVLAENLLAALNDPTRLNAMKARSQRNLERFSLANLFRDVDRVYRELTPARGGAPADACPIAPL